MAYVPIVLDDEAWKQHFVAMAKGKNFKGSYIVKDVKSGKGEDSVIMVSPTQQEVERAKDDIQTQKEYKKKETVKKAHMSKSNPRSNNVSAKKKSRKK